MNKNVIKLLEEAKKIIQEERTLYVCNAVFLALQKIPEENEMSDWAYYLEN